MTIYRALAEIEEKGQTGALCMIVRNLGSTPRHVGSKMLVYPDGRLVGTIGGGEMESRVRNEALAAIQDGRGTHYSSPDNYSCWHGTRW
jgi:xanthine dehydrogenase accessory factor